MAGTIVCQCSESGKLSGKASHPHAGTRRKCAGSNLIDRLVAGAEQAEIDVPRMKRSAGQRCPGTGQPGHRRENALPPNTSPDAALPQPPSRLTSPYALPDRHAIIECMAHVVGETEIASLADNQDTADETALTETLIKPDVGWQAIGWRELWRYRELLYFLAWRDVKVRYKQTVLGAAWAILQPALMMVVFTIFFGHLANVDSGGLAYPLFAFLGLLPWTFFATAIASAGNSVVGSERLITKVYFPRLLIPFGSVAAALVDLLVAFSMLLLLMLWYRVPPTSTLLFAPGILALIVLAALGVGALLAALNVAYRDFRYVIPFLVQLWMFATPTIYMQIGGGKGQSPIANEWLFYVNPLTGLIAAFRATVVGDPLPLVATAWSAAAAVLIFVAGCLYFRRVEDSFADII